MTANLGGIDFSQYQSWQRLEAPNGAVYYVVPGTGYVYDPFLSSVKGRPVLFANPQPEVDERNRIEEERQDQIRAQKRLQSPAGQLLPVVGSVGGTIGGMYAIKALSPATVAGVTPSGQVVMSDGAIKGVGAAAEALAPTAPSSVGTGGTAFAQGAGIGADAGGAYPLATTADGGLLMSDGTISVAGTDAAGAAAGGEVAAPTVLGNFGSMGIGPQAGIVLGTLLTAKGLKDLAQGKNDKSPVGLASRAQTALSTFGFSEIARAFGVGNHKSTKQYQKERWGKLEKDGVTNAAAAYAANHPEDDSGVWQTGKYAGEKWTFEKAKDLAKEDPTHFQLVLGNLETFGNDWSNYSDAQQKSIVSRLLAEDLYDSDKGDIRITDKDRARAIKDEVLGFEITPAPSVPDAANPAGPVTAPPRGNGLPGTPGAINNAQPISSYDGKPVSPWAQSMGARLAQRFNARGGR